MRTSPNGPPSANDPLRHVVRDRLATLRDAAYYLERRVEPTSLWHEDPRIPQFFALIRHELAEIERVVIGGAVGVPVPQPAVDTAKLAVRVLIADDHEGNRTTLAALLADEGFIVDEVGTFEGACARLEAAAPYDVVLLERRLDGHDGTELIPLVRAVEPGTRVVIVSVDDEQPMADVDAIVRKDRGYDVLRARIGELLARS